MDKIERLREVINAVSDIHGGDNNEWLEEYIELVAFHNNLDEAIEAFETLIRFFD